MTPEQGHGLMKPSHLVLTPLGQTFFSPIIAGHMEGLRAHFTLQYTLY